jgi:E3 ubiquitin-protein ligase Topors
MDWEGEASRRKPAEDMTMDVEPSSDVVETKSEGEANKERCVICLMGLRDRTIVGVCGHEFCVSLLLQFEQAE